LAEQALDDKDQIPDQSGRMTDSAVLLPIMFHSVLGSGSLGKPCLVLNKRSAKVRQPGDLCYPGGGIGPWDRILAKLQRLPSTPISKWMKQTRYRFKKNPSTTRLSLRLTICLRESWEEMRLNPFRVSFLGALPAQQLVLFQRTIHPMVGWVNGQAQFKTNWEVERIVLIPLEQFLDPRNYGRYRLTWSKESGHPLPKEDFPCFIFQDHKGLEVLWGATYRITLSFLSLCFGFSPPASENLQVVRRHMGRSYFNGR
jgi:hypothetical protein